MLPRDVPQIKRPSNAEIKSYANQTQLFSSPFKWILYHSNPVETILNDFRDLWILLDSDFILVEVLLNRTELIIRKIFKKHVKDKKFEIENAGIWRRNYGFVEQSNYTNIVVRDRKNLGINLRASLVITHNDSLKHLTDQRDKHIDSITKVNYVIVLLLASIYNITLNFSICNTWGYKDNKSEWSGMMGELTRREADIGGTSLFLLKERIDLIEYIAMISPTRSKFVFRQPKLSYVANVYTLPFDTKVWLSTFAIVVIMTFVLLLLIKWEYAKQKLTSEIEKKENQIELRESFGDIVLVTFGAFCQQAAAALPYSTPGRVATLCLFVSLMFLYVSYSANIVALLQTSSNSIKTLEDLLKSRIPVGVDDTVFNHFFFSTTTEPTRRALYLKKVAPPGKSPNFFKIEDGVKKMRQGLFAFHMETGAGYKIVSETFKEDEKCGLQEIQFLQVVDPWLAIQKNSSYKELFKIGLRLIAENGIEQRENNLIYTKKPHCASKGSAFFSVGLVDCYLALVILLSGILGSFIIFIIEIYAHYNLSKPIHFLEYFRNK
ncbi:hypothetical protein ABEB36_003407 [Hypothenemus hampei]|uniref:Ionotropic glutamate receptor C-terminal domain-containing protein n=1 Tax=Hypothenemus hampei TaxID=57062 RepID=A0ABD1F920_HYPHA